MGNQTFGIPVRMASSLVQGLNLTEAVETGTYLGDTTRILRSLVPKVWTVELSDRLYLAAQERLRDLDAIEFISGDSAEMLKAIAPQLRGPTLFWLDAHFMAGGIGAGAEAQCPIIDEIATVDSSSVAESSVLLIDDADLFLGGPPPDYRRSDFPTFVEIVDALRVRHDRLVTVVHDVIVAVPLRGQPVIEAYCQSERERILHHELTSVVGRARRTAKRVLPEPLYSGLRNLLT
jgi:hypothetical protein